MTDQELFEEAKKAADHAVCSASGFPVGAALLSADGRVFTGCNVESPSIIQVTCAERVALLKALSEGARAFSTIALYTPKAPGAPPCGVCRQMLFEFAPDLIVVREIDDALVRDPLQALLPEGFRLGSSSR